MGCSREGFESCKPVYTSNVNVHVCTLYLITAYEFRNKSTNTAMHVWGKGSVVL